MNLGRLLVAKKFMHLALLDKLKLNIYKKEEIKITMLLVYTVDIGTSYNKLFMPNLSTEDLLLALF
jgi:hypothetical protein